MEAVHRLKKSLSKSVACACLTGVLAILTLTVGCGIILENYRLEDGKWPLVVVRGYQVKLLIESDMHPRDRFCVIVSMEYSGRTLDTLHLDSIPVVTIDSISLRYMPMDKVVKPQSPTDSGWEFVTPFFKGSHLIGPSRRFEDIPIGREAQLIRAVVYLTFKERWGSMASSSEAIPFSLQRRVTRGIGET